jgi:dCMP deaminase
MKSQSKTNGLFKDIVNRFAQESHCTYIKVAAIAVKNGRIIATGINGTPFGVINCDEYFFSYWKQNIIGVEIQDWIKTEEFKKLHHEWADLYEQHAEMSIVAESVRNGVSLLETDVYVSYQPCKHCSKFLASMRPNRIFYINDYDKAREESRELLSLCNIELIKI